MKVKYLASMAMLAMLGACSTLPQPPLGEPIGQEDAEAVPGEETLPENIVQLAAPYQDLSTARLNPEDGCYWYLHEGPVETTWLPLRANDGRRICTPQSSS